MTDKRGYYLPFTKVDALKFPKSYCELLAYNYRLKDIIDRGWLGYLRKVSRLISFWWKYKVLRKPLRPVRVALVDHDFRNKQALEMAEEEDRKIMEMLENEQTPT